MSSLFQGFVTEKGEVRSVTAAPGSGSVIYRGIALDAAKNAVHVSTSATPTNYVGGVPVTSNGVVCITETPATPEATLPGGLRTIGGRLYSTAVDVPQVIHQGVGLRTGGRLCRVAV